MPEERKPRKVKREYHFDLGLIGKRLRLMGLYDLVSATLMERHGLTVEEVFGEECDRSSPQVLARNHVYWIFREHYGWSTYSIAKWFGVAWSTLNSGVKKEEAKNGKANRRTAKTHRRAS